VDKSVPDLVPEAGTPVSGLRTSTYPASQAPASPTARRQTAPAWRDPRLVVGIILVTASVLAGAALFAGADDTVGVWAVRDDLRAGSPLRPSDLVRREVRFSGPADADRYVSADAPVPQPAGLTRDVGGGELLPRSALGLGVRPRLVEVPISAAADMVPATVRAGSVVDVWVTPDATRAPRGARSTLVLDDVTVVAAPAPGTSLAPSSTRQVIVGVGPDQEPRLERTLGLASSGTVVITVQG
jgi:hypothetical protein